MISRRQEQLSTRQAKGNYIPEKIQKPMRERLRLLRLSRARTLTELHPIISTGALGGYENHDLSTLTLHQLFRLAPELGLEFRDLVLYLFDSENSSAFVGERSDTLNRMVRIMALLDDEDQVVACNLADQLIDRRTRHMAASGGRGFSTKEHPNTHHREARANKTREQATR